MYELLVDIFNSLTSSNRHKLSAPYTRAGAKHLSQESDVNGQAPTDFIRLYLKKIFIRNM